MLWLLLLALSRDGFIVAKRHEYLKWMEVSASKKQKKKDLMYMLNGLLPTMKRLFQYQRKKNIG